MNTNEDKIREAFRSHENNDLILELLDKNFGIVPEKYHYFEAGYKKAQAESQWIRVEDRLPEEEENIRVLVFGCFGVASAFWAKNPRDTNHKFYWEFSGYCGLYENHASSVTHWQPLPEPPEVK